MTGSQQTTQSFPCSIGTTATRRVTVIAMLTLATLAVPTGGVHAEESEPVVPAGDYADAIRWLGDEFSGAVNKQPLLVVWLFDESESMKDDQHEVSQRLPELYDRLSEKTETVVAGFGDSVHLLTKTPATSVESIRAAVSKIPIDQTGREKMCRAVGVTVLEYAPKARASGHRMVTIVVTDESPSDARDDDVKDYGQIEEAIQACRKAKVPVYVLGREAVFGNAYSRLRWVDPVFRLNHWIRINSGPDTANPERLNWNGFSTHKGHVLSGFGPYSQERLCEATDGGFFALMASPGLKAFDARRSAMAGYEPELITRREYEVAASRSPFRAACRTVIRVLNPATDKKLSLREMHYSIEPQEFRKQGLVEVEKIAYARSRVSGAIDELKKVQALREAEPSKRWQANYDLLYAQCRTLRARLLQHLLALDEHAAQTPKPRDPKHNRWMIRRTRKTVDPAADVFQRIQKLLALKDSRDAFIDHLKAERAAAEEALDHVIAEHPGTPWSVVARSEKTRGYGLELVSYFHEPRYQEVGKRITIPKF